ncbi:MAG: hypothetical protein HY897_02410 [Deltaproteobacteria bacterium]|nr:hypothetical protein [Deltaproteobacteria bacterium]
MSVRKIHGASGPPDGRRPASNANPSHPDGAGGGNKSGRKTSYAANTSNAWNVNFDNGNVNNNDKTNNNNVRCVRGGTWGPGRAAGRAGGRP